MITVSVIRNGNLVVGAVIKPTSHVAENYCKRVIRSFSEHIGESGPREEFDMGVADNKFVIIDPKGKHQDVRVLLSDTKTLNEELLELDFIFSPDSDVNTELLGTDGTFRITLNNPLATETNRLAIVKEEVSVASVGITQSRGIATRTKRSGKGFFLAG